MPKKGYGERRLGKNGEKKRTTLFLEPSPEHNSIDWHIAKVIQ
jgi:hypothetical protein